MVSLNRDMIVMALLVAVGGTLLLMLGLIAPLGNFASPEAGNALVGLGLLFWLYSAVTALEAASLKAVYESGIALGIVAGVAGLGFQFL